MTELYNTLTLEFAKDQPTSDMRSVAVIIYGAMDFCDHGHLFNRVMVDNELFSLPHYCLANAVKKYSMYLTLPKHLQDTVLDHIKY